MTELIQTAVYRDKDGLILLPTYNERENINLVIPKIFDIIPEARVLVIDDNSPDKTAAAVRQLMKVYPGLDILERQNKTGLGDAYKEGIKQAIKDDSVKFIITMDADGSHSPEYLKSFINDINHYDLIIGSRYVSNGGTENWEWWRRKLSGLGNLYAKLLTGLNINDFTAGFMCIRKNYLERVDIQVIGSLGYSFLIELKFYLIYKLKARVKEIPIIFRNRIEGESKLSNKIIIEGVKTLLRLLIVRMRGQ